MRPAVERSEGALPPEHLPARSENCSGGNPNSGGEKLKVVWLLHGAGGDHRSFLETADLDGMMRKHPAIYVLPSALNSDFGNYEQFGTGYDFPGYFFEELMPFIYATFPASPAREDTYLAGVSMGGFGTFSLGLQRPDRFAALMLGLYRPELFGQIGVLGSTVRESEFLKPYLDYSGDAFRKEAMADPTKLPTEFGNPAYGITLKEINMISRYPTVRDYVDSMECTIERFDEAVKAGTLPNLYFCCGEQDSCCEKVKAFREHAEALGATDIAYEFVP